jgi:hypothetical protein
MLERKEKPDSGSILDAAERMVVKNITQLEYFRSKLI